MKTFVRADALAVTLFFFLALGFLIFHPPKSVLEEVATIGFLIPLPVFLIFPKWRHSEIFSEALKCYGFALIFVGSIGNDKTAGFMPSMWAVMLGFSVIALLTSIRERPRSGG